MTKGVIKGTLENTLVRLKSTDARARADAVWTLGELRATDFAKDIAPLLKDQSVLVCRSVAWALGKMKAKRYAKNLLLLLKDEDPWVRENAIHALHEMGVDWEIKIKEKGAVK